jgi:hypothetical protein
MTEQPNETTSAGCCIACRGVGADLDGPCSDCLGTGHAHAGPCVENNPSPRVFLPGDTVPAGVAVLTNFGDTWRKPDDWSIGFGTAVEITIPSEDEWDAAVARARAEREDKQ